MRPGGDAWLNREAILTEIVEADLDKAKGEPESRIAIDEFRQSANIFPNTIPRNQEKEAARAHHSDDRVGELVLDQRWIDGFGEFKRDVACLPVAIET